MTVDLIPDVCACLRAACRRCSRTFTWRARPRRPRRGSRGWCSCSATWSTRCRRTSSSPSPATHAPRSSRTTQGPFGYVTSLLSPVCAWLIPRCLALQIRVISAIVLLKQVFFEVERNHPDAVGVVLLTPIVIAVGCVPSGAAGRAGGVAAPAPARASVPGVAYLPHALRHRLLRHLHQRVRRTETVSFFVHCLFCVKSHVLTCA